MVDLLCLLQLNSLYHRTLGMSYANWRICDWWAVRAVIPCFLLASSQQAQSLILPAPVERRGFRPLPCLIRMRQARHYTWLFSFHNSHCYLPMRGVTQNKHVRIRVTPRAPYCVGTHRVVRLRAPRDQQRTNPCRGHYQCGFRIEQKAVGPFNPGSHLSPLFMGSYVPLSTGFIISQKGKDVIRQMSYLPSCV
jgi:hypothetical protein